GDPRRHRVVPRAGGDALLRAGRRPDRAAASPGGGRRCSAARYAVPGDRVAADRRAGCRRGRGPGQGHVLAVDAAEGGGVPRLHQVGGRRRRVGPVGGGPVREGGAGSHRRGDTEPGEEQAPAAEPASVLSHVWATTVTGIVNVAPWQADSDAV